MKYVLCCPNEACELHGVAFTPGKYVMKYSKELKKIVPTIVGKPYECSNCREQMVFTEVESTIPEFSVGVFKGLPDDKKKEILRQRFDRELKRGAADEKEQRKKNAIEKMIGYGK